MLYGITKAVSKGRLVRLELLSILQRQTRETKQMAISIFDSGFGGLTVFSPYKSSRWI